MPQWPIENVKLSDLDLDLLNVRIPVEGLDEPAIINYLMEEAKLLDLVTDILRDGYIDNELPLVVLENGRYVVLEGNRRVSALKVIQDPGILGDTGRKRVDRVLSRFPGAELPPQLRVMVVPSRDDSRPTLARLHIGLTKQRWEVEQQSAFFHAQLSAMSVDELRARYPAEASDITKFIRMGEMRRVILGLRFDDRDLEDFVKSGKLSMSSLEYAYDKPKIQQALELVFSKDGLLPTSRLSEGQRLALMYLLERFKDKTLNTRSPEFKARSSQHEELVAELTRIVVGKTPTEDDRDGQGKREASSGPGPRPNAGGRSPAPGSTTGGGRGTPPPSAGNGPGAADSTQSSPAASESAASPQPGSRGPNRGDTYARLDMGGFTYAGSSRGLERRIEELKGLDVQRFPNAAFDLLRTILECSIKVYFKDKGQPLTGTNTQLKQCVEKLGHEFQAQNNRRMTALISALDRRGTVQAHQFSATQTALNASNHEPDLFVTGQNVHEAWDLMKPILIEIIG
jgi:hypothetical protein